MIQQRTVSENLGSTNVASVHPSIINSKYTVKERKAAKRKEKSRVAAQIRRNKESQTLILLQNALPLSLPSPSQMLEKSIVIRIAGQTLFLMNTLDQVLGMNGDLTIPLVSNNFLTFFMDSSGDIVYASPNIQLLLEQHHWSNLIGMSISDVIDCKSRWPTPGEVVRMRLSLNPSILIDSSFSSSSTISQPNSSRTSIASKLSLRKNSPTWNFSSSTCSLFNVWFCSSINHTNSKLRLLILQVVQIKSSVLNTINNQYESPKHVLLANNPSGFIERSTSWPSISSAFVREPQNSSLKSGPDQPDENPSSFRTIYHQMISSAHDKHYNFKSASTEFCKVIDESPKSLAALNLMDIIHLEDVVKVKSILDLIVKNNDSHVWTPLYRVVDSRGRQTVLRTLVKQYSTSSSYSLILNHLLIKSSQERGPAHNDYERSISGNAQGNLISLTTGIDDSPPKTLKKKVLIMSPNSEGSVNLKRKSSDKRRTMSCEKYFKSSGRVETVVLRDIHPNEDQPKKPLRKIVPSGGELVRLKSELMLTDDPFLPMSVEERLTCFLSRSPRDSIPYSRNPKPSSKVRLQPLVNRSPSYSLESCVLTSPGSESTDVPFDDHFLWDIASSSFKDMSPSCYWSGDQDQFQTDELDLLLSI